MWHTNKFRSPVSLRRSEVALANFSIKSRVNYACESSNRINHLRLSCEFLVFEFFAFKTNSPCFEKCDLTFSSLSNMPGDFGIIIPSQNGTPASIKG